MRIALLQDQWWPEVGGGATHVRELSRAIVKKYDDSIDILTRSVKSNGESYSSNEHLCSGRVYVKRIGPCTDFWNPIGRIASIFTTAYHVVLGDYDIVHAHSCSAAVAAQIGSILSTTPCLLTVHGSTLNTNHGRLVGVSESIRYMLEYITTLKFKYEYVISVSDDHVKMLKDNHERVLNVQNGVNVKEFEDEEEKIECDYKETILYIGRLSNVKRVSDLIKALAKVPREAGLLVVGDGPERGSLEKLAKRLGVINQISFAGKVAYDEVPSYFATADLFVLPSLREGNPMTVLEAWAAGVPVVATDVEGLNDLIDHRRTGWLVPPQDPTSLATAISRALDTTRSDDWVETAREEVQQNHSWKIVAKKTRDIYSSLL